MIDNFTVRGDYSASFQNHRKRILGETENSFREYVRLLKPRYWVVWRDIALGYVALFSTLMLVWFVGDLTAFGLGVVVFGAVSIGYWVHYFTLFIHEAAHRNISDITSNDILANLLICWFVGIDIARYRRIHFEHHRLLGTCSDTESSYFNSPSISFLLKTLFGMHAISIILKRTDKLKCLNSSPNNLWQINFSLIMHSVVLGIFFFYGHWPAAVAWIVGVCVFFPFFATVRQLLEHRDIAASSDKDYHMEPHGAVTRIFGNDIFSATFGAAGFNRHLIHHWLPQVSYTRFAEVENFLLGTKFSSIIKARRCSYWAVLWELIKASKEVRL